MVISTSFITYMASTFEKRIAAHSRDGSAGPDIVDQACSDRAC
jgi:hypothetical protein